MSSSVLTTAASARLESLFRKLYTATVALSGIEVVANGLSQAQYLDPLSYLFLALFVASVLAPLISSFFGSAKDVWFWIHGGMSMLIMLIWPWAIPDPTMLPAEFQPWIWWGVGMAAISVGVTTSTKFAIVYLIANSVIWFLLDTSPFGGASDQWVSFQDSVYIFLFSGTVIGLVSLVREGARQVDSTNTEAIQAAIAQAQVDAIERERQRIDALVHDRVLNTLLLAAKAKTLEERGHAVALAQEAITSLSHADEDPHDQDGVTPLGLFRALKRAAIRLVPEVVVETSTGGTEPIPGDVAQALTEATLQALDNAHRHSRASKILLRMDSPSESEIQIWVEDNGVGFRVDRVPRDRIGIKTSIYSRMNLVGGAASINSEVGQGTKILLRWAA
ncbi:MAG: hypothetical protein K9G13_06960 [Aquiluna sp.]|nr:hypothetical protein [Aquiluna sp.]MCF8546258.1 hypothetical protein [Aquiluna sp.]